MSALKPLIPAPGPIAARHAKPPRYLTKSRYQLGLECPTKLYYTGKPEYHSTKMDDPFMQALAQGGYQVGELARHYFPDGHTISSLDYDEAERQTQALLQQEHVVIYEPAILNSSPYLQQKYSQPIYGAAYGAAASTPNAIPSYNFTDHQWVKFDNGNVIDPYKQLPRLFSDVSDDELEFMLSEEAELADGGAAMKAYA